MSPIVLISFTYRTSPGSTSLIGRANRNTPTSRLSTLRATRVPHQGPAHDQVSVLVDIRLLLGAGPVRAAADDRAASCSRTRGDHTSSVAAGRVVSRTRGFEVALLPLDHA